MKKMSAKQISADLLFACEQAMDYIGDRPSQDKEACAIWLTLEAAVAKAKGE